MLYVRKINTKKWSSTSPGWVIDDDIEADPIGDLVTSKNKLSVYEISNHDEACRAIATVIAGSMNPVSIGYVIIEHSELEHLGCNVERSTGETVDEEVNSWHRDIVQISGRKLLQMAIMIRDNHKAQVGELFEAQVGKILAQSIQAGHLKKDSLKIKPTHRIMEFVNRYLDVTD